jgi:hypothetical protein
MIPQQDARKALIDRHGALIDAAIDKWATPGQRVICFSRTELFEFMLKVLSESFGFSLAACEPENSAPQHGETLTPLSPLFAASPKTPLSEAIAHIRQLDMRPRDLDCLLPHEKQAIRALLDAINPREQ